MLIVINEDADNFGDFRMFCFDNPPLRQSLASSSISTFQHSANSPIMSQGIRESPIMSQAIENPPTITALEKQAGDSPIGSQGIGDTHELTAMEKLTKLKTQWLSQLP